jgi:hypothetical protein
LVHYDVDAALMQLLQHERGIHAVWPGAGGAEVTGARFHVRAALTLARSPEMCHTMKRIALAGAATP